MKSISFYYSGTHYSKIMKVMHAKPAKSSKASSLLHKIDILFSILRMHFAFTIFHEIEFKMNGCSRHRRRIYSLLIIGRQERMHSLYIIWVKIITCKMLRIIIFAKSVAGFSSTSSKIRKI